MPEHSSYLSTDRKEMEEFAECHDLQYNHVKTRIVNQRSKRILQEKKNEKPVGD